MGDRLPRKLAAILYADVAGYSRLTGEDEDTTHRTLSDYLDLISTSIESHGGQVMHYAGDAVLAKFDAVVDTVSTAVAIQDELNARNEGVPDQRKVQFRIGVNLGDVIEDRGDIYGDGVNIAARLESLADPGGVCLSGAVRSAIGKKLGLDYEDLGEQEVKNISEPVRVYRIVMTGKKLPVTVESVKSVFELPPKPSIAVLPFTNMSGDPEQEYFSDGITEDIISELSRFRELFVIARNSSFTFKGQSVDVSEVASKLGVQYVVEGSVRKAANRVRVTAQLIDGINASHIWADRYDRVLEDIFTVQDEVVAAIVSAIPNQIRHVELARPQRGPTDIRAYDLVLHADPSTFRTREAIERGITLLERALEIEPDYAVAHAWLSAAYAMDSDRQLDSRSEATAAKIMKHARRAVELDQTDGTAYSYLSDACLFVLSDLAEARVHAERAVSLNPNATVPMAWMGYIHNCYGESEHAMELCARAIRLDPLASGFVKFLLGIVYFDAGKYDHAMNMFLASDWDERWPHLAAVYALTGQTDRAQEIAKRTRQEWGEDSSENFDERIEEIFTNGEWYTHGNHDGSFIEGLRVAGFFGLSD
jgi:adenylate cyclase